MNDYDPIPVLCERIRELLQIWANLSLDIHPAFPRAQAEVDRAEQWHEENRLVMAEVRR